MSDTNAIDEQIPWLDQDEPLEPDRSEAQITTLTAMFPAGARLLDLGCGGGRTVAPLARAGIDIVGIDHDAQSLARCRERLDDTTRVELHQADFLTWTPAADHIDFDGIVCLGNTMMTIVDVDHATTMLRRFTERLGPRGVFVMDDIPGDFWPEITEGNWQTGMSPDGEMQMLWAPDDAVFTIRLGAAVDPDDWSWRPTDTRYRMWSSGALALLAAQCGLSGPERDADAGLLVMRRLGEARPT